MGTKFTSKKDKVSISTESNIEGVNISIQVYGQKIVTGNGEQLSVGHVAGNINEVIQSSEFDKIKDVDIKDLIDKAIEDFKSK